MDALVDVAGRARLVLLGASPAVARAVAERMDPYPLVPASRETIDAGRSDVILEAVDGPPPTFLEVLGDAGDELATAWDGTHLHLLAGGSSCQLPIPRGPGPRILRYRPGFPVWSILGPVLGPVLHEALAEHGAVVVHASAVELEGEAVLVSGWSESGKTETALALAVAGAPLLADKWAVVAPGPDGPTVAPFPGPLTIRRWLLDEMPALRSALPSATRIQFGAAAVVAPLLRGLADRSGDGPISGLAYRLLRGTLALADRAPLRLQRLRDLGVAVADAPTRPRRLRAVVTLATLPAWLESADPVVIAGDARMAAARLARSGAVERRTWRDLVARAGYLLAPEEFPDEPAGGGNGIAETDLLELLLADLPVIEVRTPFRAITARASDAVRAALAALPPGDPADTQPEQGGPRRIVEGVA